MYIELYDESKDLYERVASFKNKSNTLLERYGNGAAQHYQYENAIMTYLWLRYPDKYYIYKLSEVKAVSSELESDYRFKKGAYADNIRNFVAFYDEICAELQQDDELKNLLNSQLTSTCYADPELRTLTIDAYLRGEEERREYLSGNIDINYFDYDDTHAKYSVGEIGNGMKYTIERASVVREIQAVEGSKLIFKKVLPLMGVEFVRYGMLTVVPFPFKYLREYIVKEEKSV